MPRLQSQQLLPSTTGIKDPETRRWARQLSELLQRTYRDSAIDHRQGFFNDIITKSPWIDVRAFGAVGDGVTDDSTAIQDAINDAEAAGGGTIVFPQGIYLANDLTVDTPTASKSVDDRIAFIGYHASIKNTHASNHTIIANFTAPDYHWGLFIKGLHFDGQGKTTSAIYAVRCPRIHIEDCIIYNHRKTGVTMDGCFCAVIDNVTVKGEDVGAGIGILYSATGGNLKIINCIISTYLFGIRAKGGTSGGLISGCNIASCTYGAEIKSGYGGVVIGNYFEKNIGGDLSVGTSDTDFQYGLAILGNHFDGSLPTPVAISLDYARDIIIKGNSAVLHSTNFISVTANTIIEERDMYPNYTSGITNYSNFALPSFANVDATPSISAGHTFLSGTAAETITDFTDKVPGKEFTITSKAAITYDTTGTNLVGSTVDIVTASGDITRWICEDNTTVRLMGFVDIDVDNSGGA